MKTKKYTNNEILKSWKHSAGAKQAFKDLVGGKITLKEFEAQGYKLA